MTGYPIIRQIDCPACHGEGGIYTGHANDPNPTGYRCDGCDGKGWILDEEESYPIEEDDFEEAFGP